ncbi:MAG: peroxidase family protein [Phycisphaerales bacterium]
MNNRAIWLMTAASALCSGLCLADDRTMDGTGNNLANNSWGSAHSNLLRGTSGAHYVDGFGAMLDRGNPRAISNAISSQVAPVGNARLLSSMTWQWGQFIDHDFALVEAGSEFMPIPIPTGDPMFDPGGTGTQFMDFTRNAFTGGTPGNPRQHSNVITHWIDGSQVYGSDDARGMGLRTGTGGMLRSGADGMLPLNTTGLPNAPTNAPIFRVAGDIRSNEQTGLTAMHTLFMREHNRVAAAVGAANPGMTDEQIYQRARKIVGAEIQSITYNEWLPALMGGNSLGSYTGYNPAVDGTLNTAFSTAAFRVGHTLLNEQLLRFNEDGSEYAGGHLTLFQTFFNTATMQNSADLSSVLRGLARQQANEIDPQAIDSVRNFLFGDPTPTPRDLIATNLARGRDHGIPDYNSIRADYGLTPVTSFSEITSDAALAAALQAAYGGDVNNIDAWIGLMAEDHLPGGSFGLTLTTVFNEQFGRLRDGDRFFYLNDSELSPADIAMIESMTLSRIIQMNTDVVGIQPGVFFVPAPASGMLLAGFGWMLTNRRRRA